VRDEITIKITAAAGTITTKNVENHPDLLKICFYMPCK
jgi:hypothetical protein